MMVHRVKKWIFEMNLGTRTPEGAVGRAAGLLPQKFGCETSNNCSDRLLHYHPPLQHVAFVHINLKKEAAALLQMDVPSVR